MFGRVALTLLVLLHAYIGERLLSALVPAHPLAAAGGAAALVALFLLTVTGLAPMRGREEAHGWLGWAALIALGFFSSLLVLTLARDAVLLLWRAVALLSAGAFPGERFVLGSALVVPLLTVVATLLGLVNARRVPAVREVDVPIAGLPSAWEGYTIVQITDLHVGPTIRRGFVERVVDATNALQADLVTLTGDLVDGEVDSLRPHTQPLSGLRARDGVFAVTGNHEYYSGADEWVAEYRRLSLRVLMNEHVLIERQGSRLMLAGVPDYSAHHFDAEHRSDPARAAQGAPAQASPRVLLAHQPRTAEHAAAAGFDLQLSGHTHGGQFFPWNWLVPLQQPYVAGLHRHGRMWVYVSRGTGYWGPPKRLGAPSEITRLRLVAA